MQVDLRLLAVGVLDGLDDVVGRLRLEQGGHVLQGDGISTHVEQLTSKLDIALNGVDRADRVANGALRVLAGLLDGSHGVRHVAGIIHGVEDTEHVHAVLSGLVDEAIDDLVVVVAVTQQVLATQQHLETAVGHQLAERAQTLPRILVEEADTRVIRGTTPTLH